MANHKLNDRTNKCDLLGSHPLRVPDYELLRCIGSGSYGEVWLARNATGTYRAIKFVYRKMFAHERPFDREFAGLKKFEPISRSHPGWVNILHVGRDEADGYFYYVMEAADDVARGQAIHPEDYTPKTLASELAKRGRLPLDECVRLGLSLTDALGQLHGLGLIHRDVKPSNIIFVNAVPKLADIGLVTCIGEAATFVGTEGYIPPEGPGSPSADLYSLGKLLYEVCLGKDPRLFPELPTNLEETSDSPQLMKLNEIILRACDSNPRRRFRSAQEMHDEISRVLRKERKSDLPEPLQGGQTTSLVTILFTDIVDSTALKQRIGDRAGATIARTYRDLVRSSLDQFPGSEEIETAGDSFLIIFARPSDAVKFALVLQSRMRQHKFDNEVALRERLGIHLGEVVIAEGEAGRKPKDLYGIQIDTCARVMALAQGGQILMTRAVFDNARQVLKGEDLESVGNLTWVSHGPYLLKGVEGSIEVCEVGETGVAPLSPPLTSEKAQRHATADVELVMGWRPALDQIVPNTKWVLEEKLGEGGFGEVWLGRHEAMREHRVFKFCFRADRIRALKREVTLFRLMKERVGEHPNILNLREVYFDAPPFYIEMDYVAGKDLKTWCEEHGGVKNVRMATLLEIVAQAADALQAAHEAGVIHRDVKPGNILISGKRTEANHVQVKLADFGIGQVVSQEYLSGVTRAGFTQTMMASGSPQTGTHLYMAPELIAGKPASTRSDLFSLGVVLYQLLAGDFRRPVTVDWAKAIADPLLKEDLEHCFAGSPQDRFAGAGQLAKNLRSLDQRHATLDEQNAIVAAKERSAYRRGIARTAVVSLFIAGTFLILAVYAFTQAARATRSAREATDALNQIKIQQVQELFIADESASALAYAARILRQNPLNRVAAERLVSALSQRSFALPALGPLQHTGKVVSAQFSSDGRRILTASLDRSVRLWDAQTGQPLTEPLRHDGEVSFAQFSPDGKRVATASADFTARVWDAQTGQPVTSPLKHGGDVNSAQFSPDGTRLVTASVDGTARVWDSSTGLPIGQPFKHNDSVNFAQFSIGGGRVVTASLDGSAQVWDAQTGRASGAPLKHKSGVLAAQFSPDGERVVTASLDRTARVWDARTGNAATEPLKHEAEVTSAQFSPDGKRIVTSSSDKTARLWNIATGEPIGEPLRHHSAVLYVEFSRNGKLLVTASLDRSARVWDAESGHPLTEPLKHPAEVFAAQFSPNGEEVVTASGEGAFVWDVRPGLSRAEIFKHDAAITSAQFSPDGHHVVTAAKDHSARLWNVPTGRVQYEPLRHDDAVNGAWFSPDGKRLLTISGRTARVWDEASGRLLTDQLAHKATNAIILNAQFSPDGLRVVTASSDRSAIVWAAQTGQRLIKPIEHRDVIWYAEFSPDGRRVATASQDGTARIWDAQSGDPFSGTIAHDGPVRSIRFSADGKRVVTASGDKTARVWDAATGKPRTDPLKHEADVISALFSPDDRLVLTASEDGTARVWDSRTGKPLTSPLRYGGPVNVVQFSPDGTRIVAGSTDKTVRVWDVRTGQPVTEPFRHDFPVYQSISFSPDGQWLLTASGPKACVWEVKTAPLPVASWLPELAEAVAGQRINEIGILEPVPWSRLSELRNRLNESPSSDFYTHLAKWFLADRAARTISPSSSIGTPGN